MDIQQSINRLIDSGMTQQAIAEHVGVGQAAISKLALGHRKDMLHSNALKLQELLESRLGKRRRVAA